MSDKKEKWKNINELGNYYQVSNNGRIRSVRRTLTRSGKPITYKGKIIQPQSNSVGYLRVHIKFNNTMCRYFVHRLVAEYFVANTSNKPDVNHMDSNYLNNMFSNLEWVTHKENMHHAIKNGRFDNSFSKTNEKFKADRESKQKAVIGTNVKSGESIIFKSINEAGRHFKSFASGSICLCCQNKLKTAQGYYWRSLTPQEISLMNQEWGKEK